MNQNQFPLLFQNSFDTFKVFHAISTKETGCVLRQAPKTIWQILNHLITWQEYQIGLLQSAEPEILDENSTWITEFEASDQEELKQAVSTFYSQIERIKYQINGLTDHDHLVSTKLKTLQDLSVHLSFHIGEIILMRRMMGTYPLPHEMKEFLK